MKKKFLFSFFVLILFIFLFICGCTENSKNSGSKTVDWDAQDMADDFDFSMKISGGKMSWTMDFKALEEGDKLILTDQISNISYTQFMFNSTQISFNVEEYKKMGVNSSMIGFLFDGNLTDEYNIGENVQISVTIKDFEISNESSGSNIKFEGYLEGSEPAGIFSLTQILPETCIEKI